MKSHRNQRAAGTIGRDSLSKHGVGFSTGDEGYDSEGNNLHRNFENFASITNKLFDADGSLEAMILSDRENISDTVSSPSRK